MTPRHSISELIFLHADSSLLIDGIAAQAVGIGIAWLIQKRFHLSTKTMLLTVRGESQITLIPERNLHSDAGSMGLYWHYSVKVWFSQYVSRFQRAELSPQMGVLGLPGLLRGICLSLVCYITGHDLGSSP